MQRCLRFSLVLAAVVAASCSGATDESQDSRLLVDQSTTTSAVDTPSGLAFADDEAHTLRLSVPSMDFFAPHEVDETDSVAVLITDLLSDGLTERDSESGLPVPGLADSWTVSDDHLVWTFLLGDFQFSNGAPVTAGDVVASLNRVATLGVTSLSGPNLWAISGWDEAADSDATVSGIVAVDDRTVEITLTERFEPLPEVLSGVVFGVYPAEESPQSALPLSSSVRFSPTALWEDGFRIAGEQVLGEISTIEIFVDPQGTMIAARETDMAVGVDPDKPLGDLRGSDVQRSADAFFAINAQLPPFDDALIRQAIVHAIDREAIRDVYFPNSSVMAGFVPQAVPGGVADSCRDDCAFDVAQATLLVEASPGREIPFTVDYFAEEGADDTEQRLAEEIASELRAVGLIATARSHTPEDYGRRAAAGELGLFRFGSVSTTLTAEADLGAMFETSGRDNLTGTSIERFDTLIAAGRAEPNPVVRASIYEDAERLLFAEAVVLPLVEFRHHIAFMDSIESASLEPDGSLDLNSIVFASS